MAFDQAKDYLFSRKFQFHFLRTHGLKPHHILLDLGCGPLRAGIPLIKYLEAGHYYGLEVRQAEMMRAKTELARFPLAHKRPNLILVEALKDQDLKVKFDYIWCFSVVIHMTDRIFLDFLKFARAHLKETGSLYMNVNIAPRNIRCWWKGFPTVERPMTFYESNAKQFNLKTEDIGNLGSFGHKSDHAADRQRILMLRC